MRPARALAIPAILQCAMISGCASNAPTDSGIDGSIDADANDAAVGFPTSCDASYPGRSCYESCLYEGVDMPQSCTVFCVPLASGGQFSPCNSNNPDYICRLTHVASDGGAYVECLPIG